MLILALAFQRGQGTRAVLAERSWYVAPHIRFATWLRSPIAEHGKFFNETYIAHVHLNREDSAIIVTRTRILCIILSKMQLRWEIPFDDLKTIIMDTGGIGLVMQDDVNGPFIPLPEKAQKGFLFGALSK